MADAEEAQSVRDTLREWIAADDQIRQLQAQIKAIRDRKNQLGGNILQFMRGQNLDNFVIEGQGAISRQQRTVRPRPNRSVVRTQVAVLLSDQPERMAEVLRAIEGVPEPGEADTVTTRELLTRRLPRSQHITLG
jgi:hypothetical protein